MIQLESQVVEEDEESSKDGFLLNIIYERRHRFGYLAISTEYVLLLISGQACSLGKFLNSTLTVSLYGSSTISESCGDPPRWNL